MERQKVIEAFKKMRSAASQSHAAHFDRTGRSGLGCPECIRADKLRAEAEVLFEEALESGVWRDR